MERNIEEIASKYGKNIKLIKVLFEISLSEGFSLSETNNLVNTFYQTKEGVC